MAYYLINLMSKFDFMKKLPLILNDLSLKRVFENSTSTATHLTTLLWTVYA